MSSIAIVGGGASAIAAAFELRGIGYDGEIRVFAGEETLPYDRTALSKEFMTEEIGAPPSIVEDPLLDKIELSLGVRVSEICLQTRTLAAGNERVRFDKLLLSTGARGRRLDVPGADLEGVHYLRELDDAEAMRASLDPESHLVVVGGGVIGLEIAASATRRGCRVTVIEAGPAVMGRILPPELAATVADHHREHGVQIRAGLPPTGFEGRRGRVCGVRLPGGELLRADLVAIGVGVEPRDELASAAGISVSDGILANDRFETSAEGVYACGDAANVFHVQERRFIRTESWTPAQEQGRLAARNLLEIERSFDVVPWMWSEQHDLTIQSAGFGFGGTEVVRRGDLSSRDGICYLGIRDRRLVAAAGASYGPRVGRVIRLAQRIIESRLRIDSADPLRDAGFDLRNLLRAASPT